MRRYLKISSASVLLALIAALTFSASQAQQAQNSNNQQLKYRQGYRQILMGKVVSAQTGQPVANAKVTIMTSGVNANKGNNVRNYGMRVEATATTDKNGTFLLKILHPARILLKFRKKIINTGRIR